MTTRYSRVRKFGGRKTRARKSRCRKTRARKSRTRKSRARKSRTRKSRRVYKGGSIPAPFGTWVGNGFGKGGTGYNDWQQNIHEQAAIAKLTQ